MPPLTRLARFRVRARRCARSAPEKPPNCGKWTSKMNPACANCPRTTLTRGQQARLFYWRKTRGPDLGHTPPRPYVPRPDASSHFRTLLQLLSRGAKPVRRSADDGSTRVRVRPTGGLTAQYQSLTDAEITTYDGHRAFLLALASALSLVPSFGEYKSGRIARAVMGVFPPIAPVEWRTRPKMTWLELQGTETTTVPTKMMMRVVTM